MILIDGKEYRNLTEQVLKNKQDIANHYNIDRVLADFGIKVIGVVPTPGEIPMDRTYEYGDTYAVGPEPPYDYYVWTRANESAGQPDDYFLDIGSIAIVGPEGPQGPKGEKGNTGESSKWYAASNAPSGAKENDMWLNTNTGIVSQYSNGTWIQKANIQGPQGIKGNTGPEGPQGPRGPQGIQGEAGVPGNAIQYVGILSDISQLPDPTTVPRNSAYVIQETDGNYTYFITGTTDLIWNRVPFENGSLVMVGGNPVQIFDADTKVDKVVETANRYRIYGIQSNSLNTRIINVINPSYKPANAEVAMYIERGSDYANTPADGACLYSSEPKKPRHVATKNYVDNLTHAIYNDMDPVSTILQSVPNNSLIEVFGEVALFYDENSAGTGQAWWNAATKCKAEIIKLNNIYYVTIYAAYSQAGSPPIQNGVVTATVYDWTSELWFMPPVINGAYKVTPINII